MITRFAPSPTGPLHLGHAYSAILAFDLAMAEGGEFLLRIEDIDSARCRPEWEAQIYDDLRWLGLWWPEPVMRQSERMDVYARSLERDFPAPTMNAPARAATLHGLCQRRRRVSLAPTVPSIPGPVVPITGLTGGPA
jgi:hypothetical protein